MPATLWTPREVDPGQHAVEFVERRLRHTKGEFAGKPFKLEDWQDQEIIRPLFGTIDPETGLRQYSTAYVEVPRKNGKSEIAAAVALKLLCADGEPGAEVYSAAADKAQASIVFDVAKGMVEQDPGLRKRCKIYRTKVIEVPKTGSVYRVLSADAFTKHGLNAHGIVFDELHAQPNRELWDVLTTSVGARRQPLVFAITTAGYDRKSICWEIHEHARKVAEGVVDDPSFFSYVKSIPADADWTDEKWWKHANPALGVFRSIAEMRRQYARAAESPAMQNTFRRLYLNQWTSQDERWLDLAAWDASAGEVDETALQGQLCYGGLDLASVNDVAALVLFFPMGDHAKIVCRFWVPEEQVSLRVRKDGVPYDQWVAQGLLTVTPGNVIDYDRIRTDIAELAQTFDIREIGFDRWNATQLIVNLMADGRTCTPIGQGFGQMSAPCKDLLTLVLQKQIHHGGNPVLRWMADNMAVVQDAAGNLKPSKQKSSEKIDGMVALVMATDRAVRNGHKPSVYDERGFVVLGDEPEEVN